MATSQAHGTSVEQCNGTDNVGGEAVECTVTITNNLDLATGETSSVTQVEECHGFADQALTCTTTITPSDQLVTYVLQCNGSGNGGGGTVTCTVTIVNNITGVATTSPATVNQCNGSGTDGGTEPTIVCDPFPAITTDATVTQCNGSGTGGGSTLRVRCTVLPSTQTSALPVDVDQCNGSGNGGGGFVTCSVSITNNIRSAEETPPATTPPTTAPPSTRPADDGTPERAPDSGTPGGAPGRDRTRGGTATRGAPSLGLSTTLGGPVSDGTSTSAARTSTATGPRRPAGGLPATGTSSQLQLSLGALVLALGSLMEMKARSLRRARSERVSAVPS